MRFKLLIPFHVACLSFSRKNLGSPRLIERYEFNETSNYVLTLIGRKVLSLYVKTKEVTTTVAFEPVGTTFHTFF